MLVILSRIDGEGPPKAQRVSKRIVATFNVITSRNANGRRVTFAVTAGSLAVCAARDDARLDVRRGPKRKGAFVSESALHFDGDKPNSVPEFLRG